MCIRDRSNDDLFKPAYGSFYVELKENAEVPSSDNTNLVDVEIIGETTENYAIISANGEEVDLSDLQKIWESELSSIFPYKKPGEIVETISNENNASTTNHAHTGKLKPLSHPRVIIPVFPGNNCEYDTQAAFERAGADAHTLIINNLSAKDIAESAKKLVEEINKLSLIHI